MVLVFAQAVYAAEACVSAQASAASAVGTQDMPGCADQSAAGCLAQCSTGDQRVAQPVVAVPAASPVPVLIAPLGMAEQLMASNYNAPSPGCDPSPPIRFCSFLL